VAQFAINAWSEISNHCSEISLLKI